VSGAVHGVGSRRRLLLISNPAAQNVTEARRRRVAGRLEAAFQLEHAETKGPGHAAEIAARATAEDFDLVAVLGGDGTINEVVNGLAGSPLPLALLPGGGANVLSRAVGLPRNLSHATRWLIANARREPRRIGLGRAGGRFFASNCGMGFDAELVRRVEEKAHLKRIFGDWYFVWKGVGLFFRGYDRTTPHLQVRWGAGSQVRSRLFMAIVQIVDPFTYLGRRALRFCPEARIGGGLDCFALDDLASRTVFPVLLSAFGGARDIDRNSHVLLLHGDRALGFEGDTPMPFQMDGEYVGLRTEVSVQYVPDSLSLLC
jgi:diacylglycerol kinase family enzyme